ncbi:hypothetical protein OS493_039906, partial [Desmophyllum pertusum]
KLPQGKSFDQNKKVKESKDETPRGDGRKKKPAGAQEIPEEFKNFKPSVQSKLQMKNLQENNQEMKIQALNHGNSKSSVRAYTVEHFLSDVECDNLAKGPQPACV